MDPIPVTITVLLVDPLPVSLLSETTGENSEPPLVTMRVLPLLLRVPHSVLAPAFELMTLPPFGPIERMELAPLPLLAPCAEETYALG